MKVDLLIEPYVGFHNAACALRIHLDRDHGYPTRGLDYGTLRSRHDAFHSASRLSDQSEPASRDNSPGRGLPAPVSDERQTGTPYCPEGGPPAGLVECLRTHLGLPDPGTCDQCCRPLPFDGPPAAVCISHGAFSFCSDGCLAVFIRSVLIECRRGFA